MKETGFYIPRDRRIALCAGQEMPERMTGSLLLADLSGFTQLTTIFFQEAGGGLGAELVTRALYQVFDALIDQLYLYQGSVISFSGDAIICFINDDDGHRAAACAFDMQEAVKNITQITTPAGTRIPIALKIIATAGAVRRLLVGEKSIQRLDVLAGRPVERISEVENEIQRGEVLLGAEIIAALGDNIKVQSWRTSTAGEPFALVSGLKNPIPHSPWPDDADAEISDEIARSWMLQPVYQRFLRGQGDFLSELRTAVSLFLSFSGTYWSDDHEAGHKLNDFVIWAQQVVDDYGGYLVALALGDKGSYIQAAFGAPVSRGDNSRRAVEAAQVLMDLPEHLSYISELKIGISHGRVWSGAYGGSIRKTYGLIGREVNLSARLMGLADPGKILVSKGVAERAEGDMTSLGMVSIKGISQPQEVFAIGKPVLSAARRTMDFSEEPPIVGRQSERSWLRDHLINLKNGVRNRLLIEGEPGIGKSSLVRDLIREAREQELHVIHTVADAVDQSRAYHPWLPAIYEALGADQHQPELLGQKVLEVLADNPRHLERASLLNALLPINLPANEITREMDGDLRASNLRELLTYLILLACPKQSPWVLVMDDVHWLDSASWNLLEQVWRDSGRMLLVMVTRSHMFGEEGALPTPELVLSARANPQTLLQLSPVDSGDAAQLTMSYLGVAQLGDSLRELIIRRAEGHPFYTIELVKALQEGLQIRINEGQAQLRPGVTGESPLDFPSTIEGVVTSRIDRLSTGQQLTLKVASVLGRTFGRDTLENIYPIEADRPVLGESLDALERVGIINQESSDNGQVYAFKHMIFQEVAYNLLPRIQKQQLHFSIGSFLENAYESELTRYFPLLAHHWGEAVGDVEAADRRVLKQALHYLEAAGRQAREQFGEREAIRFIHRARDLVAAIQKRQDSSVAWAQYVDASNGTHLSPAELQQADWALMLGDAYLGLGLLNESRGAYEEALRLYREPVVSSPLPLVGNLLRQVGSQIVHRRLPGMLKKRKAALQENDNLRRIMLNAVRAYERLMKIFYYSNDGGLFVNAGLTGLNLAEMLDPSTDLTRIYANMSTVAGVIPLHGLADTYGALSMETANEVNQITAHGWALTSTSVYKVGVCRWDEVRHALEEAREIFLRLGDQRQFEETLAVALTALYFEGAFLESAALGTELYASARRREDPQTQAWGLLGVVENHLRLNKMGDIRGEIKLLEQLLDQNVGLAEEVWIYGVLALHAWRNGGVEKALACAEEGKLRFLKTAPTAVYTLEGIMDVAEVFLLAWEKQAAAGTEDAGKLRKSALKSIGALKAFAGKFPVGQPAYWRLQGTYLRIAGSEEKAAAAWHKSWAAADENQMPFDAALARIELAQLLSQDDPARSEHLSAAREILEARAAGYDLARLEGITARAS